MRLRAGMNLCRRSIVSGGALHAGIALGVNIDHVATLRQARRARYPDPLYAALLAEEAGADSITLHLREDRRHIQDRDVTVMREALQTRMNLEMAVTDEMVAHRAEGAAAGLLSGARVAPGSHHRRRLGRARARARGSADAVPGARRLGYPRLAVHRSGSGTNRSRAARRRSRSSNCIPALTRTRRAAPAPANSSACAAPRNLPRASG